MAILKIDNNYSYYTTDNAKVINILWKALRFREKGYFHQKLYKQKRWDGFRDFFSNKTGRFLTGLLPEVKLALSKLGETYTIEDKRTPFNFSCNHVDDKLFNYGSDPVVLHNYQVDLINQSLKYKRGIIQAPTGSGKTFILVGILKCLPPKTPTLILTDSINLTEQNYSNIIKWDLEAGRWYGKKKEPNYITCSTVQSAEKLDLILPKIKCLIVDEVHEAMSAQFVDIYRKLKNASVKYGISATPFKFGGKDKVQMYRTKGWFGGVFNIESAPDKVLKTKFLQDQNKLASSKCTFYPISEPQIPYYLYMDAVTKGIAESEHFDDIVVDLVKKIKGRTLILVERVAHGEKLNNLISDSIWISGKDDIDIRKPVLEKLRSQKSDLVVIATRHILNTGVDINIHNLINCAGGKADHDIIQRIGRGLRNANDKDGLQYYDFMFNINPYLENHSKHRIKIFTSEGHEVVIKDKIDF